MNNELPVIRSEGSLSVRRVPLPWPEDQIFRILSIDGGGIRGVFPASFLAGLEDHYLEGNSVAEYFDLITGTSTGGIIALGLSMGLTAGELRDLYIGRGCEIFPPLKETKLNSVRRAYRYLSRYVKYRYDRKALKHILHETFGRRILGEGRVRLCIPSFDGRFGEVYVFKTPHHPDYRVDWKKPVTEIALATSAAPTFFRPFENDGYTFIDGGVWANNPIMIGLVDALSCFSVPRERIRILSLGCQDEPYTVGRIKKHLGGLLAWRDIFEATMRLQSLNAHGQAGLLIGADKITRLNTPSTGLKISLDDWALAVNELPKFALMSLNEFGDSVAKRFLNNPAVKYRPIYH